MKDVEILAESLARRLASCAALSAAARAVECLPQTTIADSLSSALRSKAEDEAAIALKLFLTNRSDLELFMSTPPINPS